MRKLKRFLAAGLVGLMALPMAVSADSVKISGTSDYGISGKTNVEISADADFNADEKKYEIEGTAEIQGVSFDYKLEGTRDSLKAEIPGSGKKIEFYNDGSIENDTLTAMGGYVDYLLKQEENQDVYTAKTSMTKSLFKKVVNRALDFTLPNQKTLREYGDELLKKQGKESVSGLVDRYMSKLPDLIPITIEMKGNLPERCVFGSGESEIVAERKDGQWSVKWGDEVLFEGSETTE